MPSCGRISAGLRPARSGELEVAAGAQEASTTFSPSSARASRPNRRASAGLQPAAARVEHRLLARPPARRCARADPVEHVRVAAEDAGRGAGRVEQDRVDLRWAGSTSSRRARDRRREPGALEISREVAPDDFPTHRSRSRRSRRRRAASSCRPARRTDRARAPPSPRPAAARDGGGMSCTHQRPSP
jgi:hypothetical protein